MTKLAAAEVAALDPYKFMAIIGKTVIHPGGRASTQALLARARITAASQVLDIGCGVATMLARLRNRLGRLDPPDFRWEGEVICAVAAKSSSPHVTPSREGPQARALPAR
jgi:hypothetical protein